MPLAQIRPVLALDPAAAAGRLSDWWAGLEAEHAARRALTDFLVARLIGKELVMYEVATRGVPERHLLCLKRNVDIAGAWELGKEFVAIMRARPLPRLPGREGATFAIYYAEVSEDTAGPAQELAAAYPELTLRTEPAHGEAYVHLGDMRAAPPQWHLVSETLMAWAAGQDRERADLAARVTLLATGPVTEGRAPDCDYAVPLRCYTVPLRCHAMPLRRYIR